MAGDPGPAEFLIPGDLQQPVEDQIECRLMVIAFGSAVVIVLADLVHPDAELEIDGHLPGGEPAEDGVVVEPRAVAECRERGRINAELHAGQHPGERRVALLGWVDWNQRAHELQ